MPEASWSAAGGMAAGSCHQQGTGTHRDGERKSGERFTIGPNGRVSGVRLEVHLGGPVDRDVGMVEVGACSDLWESPEEGQATHVTHQAHVQEAIVGTGIGTDPHPTPEQPQVGHHHDGCPLIENHPIIRTTGKGEPEPAWLHSWNSTQRGQRVARWAPRKPHRLGPGVDECGKAGDAARDGIERVGSPGVPTGMTGQQVDGGGISERTIHSGVEVLFARASDQTQGLGGVVACAGGHDAYHGGRSGSRVGCHVDDSVAPDHDQPRDAGRHGMMGGGQSLVSRRGVQDQRLNSPEPKAFKHPGHVGGGPTPPGCRIGQEGDLGTLAWDGRTRHRPIIAHR